MGKTNKKEISFVEGSVFGALIRFAVPVLGALILQAAYGAVDLMVVGQFGDASSISAVGTGSSFMQMVTFIITSLAMGSTVVIGQQIGEKKPKEAGNTVGTTTLLFAAIGIGLTVLLEGFAGKIVTLLQVPEQSVEKTILYIRICSAGIVIIIAYNVISGVLRGVGNANLPFLFVGIACVVNIVGDLLLIGVFRLDVAGAALATVFAQLVSVVLSAAIIRRQNLPICFSLAQCRIYEKADSEYRSAYCIAGGYGTDILSCGQFYCKYYGTDAVGRIRRSFKDRIFYYVGSLIGHAERIRLCGTEYRRRTESQGLEGSSYGHDHRLQCRGGNLYGWILRRDRKSVV